MLATIASLHIYPVKSCGGITLAGSVVGERGLAFDREWMVIDSGGRFVTQREYPRLALVLPSLSGTALELTIPGSARLAVPLSLDGALRPVTVWRDTVSAVDQGDEAAAWLSSALQSTLRLVRFDADVRRDCSATYAGDSGAHTAFADGYPLLILSEASLADLNTRLEQPLPMNRFRPNIVLAGLDPYDEDYIDVIRVGKLALKLVKPCTRCQITTTDQRTGTVGTEPLPTLAGYRMSAELGGVMFGMNAIVAAGAGFAIRSGDDASCEFRF